MPLLTLQIPVTANDTTTSRWERNIVEQQCPHAIRTAAEFRIAERKCLHAGLNRNADCPETCISRRCRINRTG